MLRRSEGGRKVRESMRQACCGFFLLERGSIRGERSAHEFGLVDHGGDDVFRGAYALVKGATVKLGLGCGMCVCLHYRLRRKGW